MLPLAGGLLGVLLSVAVEQADRSVHPPAYWTYSPSTASTVLSAIVGAMAALTGFVVTVTVLAVQMATGTFSARYMRLWYRDRMLKMLLALLLDHLSDVLRLIGTTDLSRSRWHAGSTGRAGLLIPARSWEDAASHGQDPTASSIMPLRSGPSWRRREPASISSARIRCSGAGSRRGTAAPPRRSGPR